jgi:glycerol-3-phosphate acyltransferase PlsY
MPPPAAQFGLLIVVAYLLGSVPFGLLVGLAKGKDPRKFGSGNIGATNAARALGGKKWFFLIFTLDMLKGLLPMVAAGLLLHGQAKTPTTYTLWLATGLAAILGHVFSVFLKFKGGKGVATSAGVMLGVWPYYTIPGLVALGVFAVVLMVWRHVSLASIVAAVSVPVAYVLIGLTRSPPWPVFGDQWPLLAFALTIAGLIVYRHRSNIARLKAGTELRLAKKKDEPSRQ